MSTVAITDRVLRDAETARVRDTGKRLFIGLSETFNVALLIDGYDDAPMRDYLRINGLKIPPYIMGWQPQDLPGRYRLNQLNRLERLGCRIDLVVESDPDLAAILLANSYRVMCYAEPAYPHRDLRPDSKVAVTPWERIETEIDIQRDLRTRDPRIRQET